MAGEDGNAIYNEIRRGCDMWQTPAAVSIGTASATPIAFNIPDSDIVIEGVEGVVIAAGNDAGADGSFKVGTAADDDAICGATTIDKDAADSVAGTLFKATLLSTLFPAVGSDLHKKYGGKPIVPAGTPVMVTHTQGASGTTTYKVQIRYRRIGKNS